MSTEEVRAIIAQVVASGVPIQRHVYALIVLVSLLASGVGAWLGSYLREKGKNFATKEDLDKIVEQLRMTTRAAEEIKAQISGELWVGQRRRELQLEVLKEVNTLFAKIKLGLDSPAFNVVPETVEQLYCSTILTGVLFKNPTIKTFAEAVEHFHLDPSRRLPGDFYKLHLEAIKAMVDEVCK